MFVKPKLFGLPLLWLLSALLMTSESTPVARIHVKFSQPPHQIQEHGITTDGGRLVSQQSYLEFGRRDAGVPIAINTGIDPAVQQRTPINPAAAVPYGSAPTHPQQQQLPLYPPVVSNDISYGRSESSHSTPDFSDGLAYPDPQLLTGDAAAMAVRYIYGRGSGLFFDEVPHTRLVSQNQQERRENNLNGNVLASLRPGSPWYRSN